jgi:uncharacterized protein DUF1573
VTLRRAPRFVCMLLLAGLTTAAATSAADPTPTPPLSAPAPRFDAGKVDAGTVVQHTFELRNAGSHPIPIVAKPSCGCTTTDYDKEIPAGGSGKVTAALDTTHVRGRVEKTIDILTGEPGQPPVILRLVVEAAPTLVVQPDDQPSIGGPVGDLKPLDLTVSAPDGAAFAITAVEDEPNLRATALPLDPADGAGHRRYRVTLTPKADLPVGTYQAHVALITTAPRAQRFELPVHVVVAGPLVLTPKQLHFGPLARTASVRVTTSTGEAFRLVHAESTDADFTPEVTAVVGAPAWDVVVRYTGKPERHGPVNAILKLATDVATQPLMIVRMNGKL